MTFRDDSQLIGCQCDIDIDLLANGTPGYEEMPLLTNAYPPMA
jgi:hypothetical protein